MDSIFLEVKLMAMDQAVAAIQSMYNNSPEVSTVTDSDSLRRSVMNAMDENNKEGIGMRTLFV